MIPSLWPWLLVAAMSGASGAAIAWRIASDRGEARRMQCEQAREHDARAAAEQATALLARSQDAQVQATRGLAQAHAARQRRLQE
ncbi:MAG: hypothetical protein N2690_12955, partial [Rhodocyclaceae bacterium]|nr:hypothetical protein [Rhodocyclaceae bacterium]